jgi:hypothetical protein
MTRLPLKRARIWRRWRLGQATTRNPWPKLERLRCDRHEPDADCRLHAEDGCLSLA